MWRAGLPRAGWRSHPNRLTMLRQTHRDGRFWGCCAAQRGQAPSPQGTCSPSRLLCDYWLYVASGLAPRWVAKPPQPAHHAPPDTPRWQDFGLLRSPAGDEPPRHKELAAPSNLLWTTVFMWRAGLPRAGWQSHPNPLTMLHQTPRGGRIWGCCAAQRGTSPLATKALSPQVRYRRCWCALSLRPACRSLPTARGCRDPRDETPA